MYIFIEMLITHFLKHICWDRQKRVKDLPAKFWTAVTIISFVHTAVHCGFRILVSVHYQSSIQLPQQWSESFPTAVSFSPEWTLLPTARSYGLLRGLRREPAVLILTFCYSVSSVRLSLQSCCWLQHACTYNTLLHKRCCTSLTEWCLICRCSFPAVIFFL